MSGWGCPHEVEGKCQWVNNLSRDTGIKGCVLFGRFRFADESKNRPKKTPATSVATELPPSSDDDKQ